MALIKVHEDQDEHGGTIVSITGVECEHLHLIGTLTPAKGIVCTLSSPKRLTGILSKTVINIPEYAGPYVVTPAFEEQFLYTDNKLMTSDVEVEAIYVSSTPNLAGGNTVYIGGTINHA